MTTDITIKTNNQFIQTYGLEVFHKTIVAFRTKAKREGLTSAEHILYNIIRDLPLDRGFSPIVNKVKLANGQYPTQGFDGAKYNLKYKLKNNFNMLSDETTGFALPVEIKDYLLSKLQ